MKRWQDVVRTAIDLYRSKRVAYLYGAFGETGSDILVDRLWSQYPEHYKKYVTDRGHTKQELKLHVRGKQCFDCSGFVSYCLGLGYHANSDALRKMATDTTTPKNGYWGQMLWKKGHVGIDFFGYVLECVSEFNDLQWNYISDRDFTESCQMWCVDYTNSSRW